jgi:hypothetical protein
MAVIPIAPIALLNVTVFLSCCPDSGGVRLQAGLLVRLKPDATVVWSG